MSAAVVLPIVRVNDDDNELGSDIVGQCDEEEDDDEVSRIGSVLSFLSMPLGVVGNCCCSSLQHEPRNSLRRNSSSGYPAGNSSHDVSEEEERGALCGVLLLSSLVEPLLPSLSLRL